MAITGATQAGRPLPATMDKLPFLSLVVDIDFRLMPKEKLLVLPIGVGVATDAFPAGEYEVFLFPGPPNGRRERRARKAAEPEPGVTGGGCGLAATDIPWLPDAELPWKDFGPGVPSVQGDWKLGILVGAPAFCFGWPRNCWLFGFGIVRNEPLHPVVPNWIKYTAIPCSSSSSPTTTRGLESTTRAAPSPLGNFGQRVDFHQ